MRFQKWAIFLVFNKEENDGDNGCEEIGEQRPGLSSLVILGSTIFSSVILPPIIYRNTLI